MRLVRLLFALFALAAPSLALAQATVLQGGPWTQGHAPMYVGSGYSQPIVQDSGPAAGGGAGVGLSEIGVTARGNGSTQSPPYAGQGTGPLGTLGCFYDGPTTGPYHYLCFSPNANGGALLTTGAGGGASAIPLNCIINGVSTGCLGSGAAALAPGSTTILPSTNGGVLFDNNGLLGDSKTLPTGLTIPSAQLVSIAPTASTLNPAFSLTQTASGSASADVFLNPTVLNLTALSDPGFNVWGFGAKCNVTSTSYSGQLFCGYTSLNVSALGTPGTPNDSFIGQFNLAIGSANTTDNDASMFAGSDNVQVTGTGWSYDVGREIDVTALQPILNKAGLAIGQPSFDVFQGSVTDAGIWFNNQGGAPGWKDGILFPAGVISTGGYYVFSPNFAVNVNGAAEFGSNSLLPSSGVPLLVHAATNVDLTVTNNGGAVDLGALNDALNTAEPMVLASSTITLQALATAGPVTTSSAGLLSSSATLSGALGGTGVANTGKTITLGGNLTTSGAFAATFTLTNTTNSTLPAGTHTLGGLDVAQTWSALQTYSALVALTPITIATLLAITCNSASEGDVAFVKDTVGSATATFHLTVAGAGATTVNSLASCNGSTWQYD